MNILTRLTLLLRSLRVELVEITGKCKLSGAPASIACVVGKKTQYYLAQHIFESGYQFNSLGSTWLWKATSLAARCSPDSVILFSETGRTNKKLLFYGRHYFRIPLWIRGQVSLPLDNKVTKKKDYREQARKIRRAGFDFEVTQSMTQFEDFYKNMYVPQVSQSHGESTVIANQKTLTENFSNFELLLVKLEDKVVAGELILYTDAIPKLRAVGVRDRDPELLRKGALSACYYFAFLYLEKQGFSRVSLGDSRGFINDGVLNFKRKWGQVLVEPKPILLLMRILQNTPATENLLKNLPLICENGGLLESIVFLPENEINSARTSEKFIQYHHVPGTDALLACVIGENMVYSKSRLVKLHP